MSDSEALVTRSMIEDFAEDAQALSVLLDEEPERRRVLVNYAKYLLGDPPRSYAALADYLEMYGSEYLFPDITQLFQGRRWDYIYELGPGTGWLINALGPWGLERYAVDKRESIYRKKEGVKFRVQDLEQFPEFIGDPPPGGPEVLVIANQFLHCVDNWQEIIRNNRAEWLVIEVRNQAWMHQMAAFGATPIEPRELIEEFHRANYVLVEKRISPILQLTFWRPL